MRERLGGVVVDSKFASSWVGGVLMSLLGRMGWGYGRISRGVGGCFQVISDLR
jgi:hypothetical protein